MKIRIRDHLGEDSDSDALMRQIEDLCSGHPVDDITFALAWILRSILEQLPGVSGVEDVSGLRASCLAIVRGDLPPGFSKRLN